MFDSISLRTVEVVSSEGTLADNNRPFVRFDSEFTTNALHPGQTSSSIPVEFSNPLFSRFDPAISLIAQGNRTPWFTSIPSMEATTNVAWTSPLTATDPDGHELTYQIVRGPVGMTVDTTTVLGLPRIALSWTPSTAAAGTHDIEVGVTDGHGGSVVQSWQLSVQLPIPLPDLAPWFRSTPPLVASTSRPYSYTPLAIDPEGLNATLQLVSGPAGLSLVAAGTTALGAQMLALQWTPLAGDIGTHTVQLKATDPSGLAAFQTWTLTVKGPNTPPQITTSPVTSVIAEGIYRCDVDAIDAEDAVHFELIGAPAGMDFDPVTGQIVWHTSDTSIGSYPLTVNAIDERGAVDSQSFVLVVSPDTQAPQVTISLSHNVISPGDSITITVNAIDNVSVIARTLTVNGSVLTLNADHAAVYTAIAPGLPTIIATAVDPQGNVGTDQIRLRSHRSGRHHGPDHHRHQSSARRRRHVPDETSSVRSSTPIWNRTASHGPRSSRTSGRRSFEVPSPSQGEGQGLGQGSGILPDLSTPPSRRSTRHC